MMTFMEKELLVIIILGVIGILVKLAQLIAMPNN